MKKQEQRRILPNITWQAERYFIMLEFLLLMMTMIYLLYLIFGTVNGVERQISGTIPVNWPAIFEKINFLLLVRVSILFVVAFLIHFMLGLFYLHRLTGPLVRIRSVLTQLANGAIPNTDVILRKGDFPTDVAKALTQALTRIRQWRHRS